MCIYLSFELRLAGVLVNFDYEHDMAYDHLRRKWQWKDYLDQVDL